jgi:hypothetical protein
MVDWGDSPAPPKGTAFTASAQQVSTFTHSYASAGYYTVTFQVMNSAGLVAQNTSTVTVGNTGYPSNSSATISTDPSTPQAQSISVTDITDGNYLNLPIFTFDIGAQGDNLHLHSVSINIATRGSGSVSAAYLYQGSTLISSTAVIGGVAAFNNIPDNTAVATIPINTSLPLTVRVDVTGVLQGGLSQITVTAQTGGTITIYNSADQIVHGSGSAAGNAVTVTNGSPTASATLSLDASTPQNQSVNVTNTTQGQYLGLPVLVFDINAQGSTLHLHNLLVDIPNSGSGYVNAAYLYQGSTLISSTAVTNHVANFSNIADGTYGATIPVNTTVPYTVKVDISGLTSPKAQETVSTEMPIGPELVIYNSADSAVTVNGPVMSSTMQDSAVIGNTITVSQY